VAIVSVGETLVMNNMGGAGLSPASLGDTTPQYAQQSYYSTPGIGLTDHYATYAALYRAQNWVATLVNKLAYNTARLPIPVYQRNPDGSRVVSDGPYAQLLASPNPEHDPFFLWLWTTSTFFVYGEAMWRKQRDRDGIVRRIWPLHPTIVSAVRQVDGELTYFITSAGQSTSTEVPIPASEIVHFRTYNPDNTVRGMSPLEPLRSTLQNEDAARRAQASFWKNGARPSMFLSTAGSLSDGAQRRLKAEAASLYGGVDNFGKVAVFEEGMQPHSLSLSAEEAQYVQTRNLNRDEVCAAYDVPPPAVHILDRATYSNIVEQMRSIYRDTMAPKLILFEAALDAQLRPDFAGPEQFAKFDMDDVLRGTPEQRAIANAQLVGTGQRTPAELRAADDLPFVEGSDRLLVNAALVPLGVMDALAPATGTDVHVLPQRVRSVTGAIMKDSAPPVYGVAAPVRAAAAAGLLAIGESGFAPDMDGINIARLLITGQPLDAATVRVVDEWHREHPDMQDDYDVQGGLTPGAATRLLWGGAAGAAWAANLTDLIGMNV